MTNVFVEPIDLPSPQPAKGPVNSWRPMTKMCSAFKALAETNFMRSPDAVTVGPASRFSRSHAAKEVSNSSAPALPISATMRRPSLLIEMDWISCMRESASAGMGSRASAAPLLARAAKARPERNVERIGALPEKAEGLLKLDVSAILPQRRAEGVCTKTGGGFFAPKKTARRTRPFLLSSFPDQNE